MQLAAALSNPESLMLSEVRERDQNKIISHYEGYKEM